MRGISKMLGGLISFLVITMMATMATAEEASFTWSPNVESNLDGYEIRWGSDPDPANFTHSRNVGLPPIVDATVGAVLINVEPGAYHFHCVAYDTDGFVSDPSNVVVQTVVNTAPAPVQTFSVQFSFVDNGDGTYSVVDSGGNVVYTTNQVN